jgi:hypothetical protein
MTETPARHGDSNILYLPRPQAMVDGPEFHAKYETTPPPPAIVIPFKRRDESRHPLSTPSENEGT